MIGEWMRRIFLLAGAFILLAGPCMAEQVLTKEQMRDMLGKPGLYVIDIRTEKEWGFTTSKIPGAVHEVRGQQPTWGKKYPKDGTIVVY
ncbi:MAG: rhodanese-like domain-containing protein [Desulfobacteraceae bacterium]|nr:rhodanese-like domain-containing protein [Desulfobacteraceae bacterium]